MSLSAVARQPQAFHDLINHHGPAYVASMVHTASQFGASGDVNMTNGRILQKGHADASKTKATRPLNSFMIFRSHYSPLFSGMQQKDISANVTNLWKDDPFKAKWAILAKAYSMIRDSSGKQNTPLDKFIAINGPYIGILASKDYLRTLGWEISLGENQLKLNRVLEVELASLDEELLTTNLSVANIISYSIDMGYVSAEGNAVSVESSEPSMIMASHPVQRVHDRSNVDTQNGVSPRTSVVAGGVHSNNHGSSNARPTATAATTSAADDAWLAAELQQMIDDEKVEADLKAKAAAVDDDDDDINLMMLSSDFYTLETEFPFNEEFDPSGASYDFDPYMGDAFNAYHIADFSGESAFAIQY
ncbi:hypothetical protein MMC11_007436 [Xylographa trunciseda]|nr:hypothetical protein [Xylographa trunciseda]